MAEMPEPSAGCTDEEAVFLPYIMVELPLPCGHPMRVFWRAEAPDDLELHHGDDLDCRTLLYDTSDMTLRAQMLVAHPDVQKWLQSLCQPGSSGSSGDLAQPA